MKVLFTCVIGYGHFHPMVPLALALRNAGHDAAEAKRATIESMPTPGEVVPVLETFARGDQAV